MKASDHFADVINTHRAATAEIIAGFAAMLQDSGIVSEAATCSAALSRDRKTWRESLESGAPLAPSASDMPINYSLPTGKSLARP